MKTLKIFLFLIILLSSLNLVDASEVAFKSEVVQNVILPGEPAIFNVEVTNLGAKGEVKVIITDFKWRKESSYGFYTIYSGKTIKDTFKLYPIGTLEPGKYSVNARVYATAKAEDFIDYNFIIEIVPYKNLVDATIEYNPLGLSPNKENMITLKLRNRHAIEIKDLNFKIKSEILNKEFTANLGKEEIKDFPFTLKLEDIKEGEYEVDLFGVFNKNIVTEITSKLKVASYPNIKEVKKEEFSFLVKTLEIARINNGNTVSKEVYSKTLTSFENLFTKVSPEPSNVERLDGYYKYTWEFSLNPSDSYFISVKTNYGRPIIIFIILALLIYIVLKTYKRGLSITKKVLLLKSSEGHILGLKILLVLKNSGHTMKHLRLTDNIPGLLELPHEYGTLKPSSTKKGLAGSSVVWEIPELLRGEERVIAYKMKSKMSTLGKLTIPRAVCVYKDKAGKLYIVKSNYFNLF